MSDFGRFKQLSDLQSMTATSQEGVILLLDPSEIEISPQVRKRFKNIPELAESMRKGQEQPIVVGPLNQDTQKYPLQKGERRVRAAMLIGEGFKLEAKVNAKALSPVTVTASQLVENVQREDLLPLEIAAALVDLREKLRNEGKKGTGKELAQEVSKPESWVSMHLYLAELPDDLKALAEEEVITDAEVIQSLRKISTLEHGLYLKLLDQAKSEAGLTRADIRIHMKALKVKSTSVEELATNQTNTGTGGAQTAMPDARGGEVGSTANTATIPAAEATTTNASPESHGTAAGQLSPTNVSTEAQTDTRQAATGLAAHRNPTGTRKKGKPEIVDIPAGQIVIQVRVALDEGLIFGELLTNRGAKDDTGWGVVSYLDGGKPKVDAFTLDRIEFVSIAQLAACD